MMREEDDQPLLVEEDNERNERAESRAGAAATEPPAQLLCSDPDFQQEIRGYRVVRWRVLALWLLTVLLLGIPRLLLHWYPAWRVYITCARSPLHCAQILLLVETYQKKCKSYYIHRVKTKIINGEDSGQENAGFQEDGDAAVVRDTKPALHDDPTTPLLFDDGTVEHVTWYKYFTHKKRQLAWQRSRGAFAQVSGLECGRSCAQLLELGAAPPDPRRKANMLNVYGLNEIAVPVRSVGALILLEVFNPFYMFQVFTIGVWLADEYYYYCIAVVLMSTFGVSSSVLQTRRNQRQLRATVESHAEVLVVGGADEVRRLDSRQVAPGDVIVLPAAGCVLQCDAVLLSGACVVNESMLTGESVPVTKTALPHEARPYHARDDGAHTLYCGTRVIQTRDSSVRAMVIRTGYNTSKGQLVRSILYPVPADFKFDRDTYKFIGILAVIAALGLIYTVVLKAARQLTPGDIIIKALDIITIVIPPALPAAMTVGRLYAVSRLQRARIYCLNTRAINVSGGIDCVCFDKTGTLTEDGLDMWGAVSVSGEAAPMLGARVPDPRALSDADHLKLGMAACHSLKLIDGQLAGDPLDLKMLESTGWVLEEPQWTEERREYAVLRPADTVALHDQVALEVGVVKQHQFVSALQRSSVVARVAGERGLRVYCKGAPETVSALCVNRVPMNLETVLGEYAARGYRVLALATKALPPGQDLAALSRQDAESDLDFLGLVILENRLKPSSAAVIQQLTDANIHVAMITGDNIHTATSVARECGIVRPRERLVTLRADPARAEIYCDSTLHGVRVGGTSKLSQSMDSGLGSDWAHSQSLASGGGSGRSEPGESGAGPLQYKVAMSGHTWTALRAHYPALVPQLVARGAVFARMTSEQKQQLIVEYQALGYYVAMCGDGANDCGALRTAHTGISLSELESSVAAPFTSQDPDISCVASVIREGRAALSTSFGVFKFMVAYSLTEFLSVAFLYYFDSNLTDFQFLFIDVALILNLAFSFGKTEAYRGPLYKRPPLSSLLSFPPLVSLTMQLTLVATVQYLSYWLLTQFPWYVRHEAASGTDYACWENYANFCVSMFQYISLAIVFSHGAPYRRSVLTNAPLVVSALVLVGLCAYITVSPARWLAEFMQLELPEDARLSYWLLGLAGAHCLVALLLERGVAQYLLERRECAPPCLRARRVRTTPHLRLARSLTTSDYLSLDTHVEFDDEKTHSTPM